MRGESARPGKRPLRALSASEKMEAIQRVHEGESKASVARDIGVPESTLRGWCKSEHKIRGMARNSSTPDSEAHSPASSSGTNMAAAVVSSTANLSSEDEGVGPSAKRQKLDCAEGDATGKLLDDKGKIDYVGLMTSMAGMRPESGSLLLQQLGLLSGATGTLAKNLLSLPASLAAAHGSTVGLVENGLQYTKSNNKRHSISAIAPTQMDSAAKSGSRKSLPPAAEAPSTPVPASPRKTGDTQQQQSRNKKDCGAGNRKIDEAPWLWLKQQQQLLGQQSASFSPSSANQQDGSWFWQWYKQCSFPVVAPTPLAPTPVAKKSPSKARALLDNVLCNNNNENVKRSLNMETDEEDAESGSAAGGGGSGGDGDGDDADDDVPASTEEAIEHGEKFFKWLDRCSDPAVTRMRIMQFKYLLDNLKACRKKPSSGSKRSRK